MEVVRAGGSRLWFGAGHFSAATLFTMLHHLGSAALPDLLPAELRRAPSAKGNERFGQGELSSGGTPSRRREDATSTLATSPC